MKKSSSLSELEKKNLAADKRLQKTYGITLADYDRMLKEQNGGCWICGKPPKGNKRLHVDHDHKKGREKVYVRKPAGTNVWVAYTDSGVGGGQVFFSRKEALDFVRRKVLRLSVRGLLCWRCNTGLQKWRDNPEHLKRAALYLEEYKSKYA